MTNYKLFVFFHSYIDNPVPVPTYKKVVVEKPVPVVEKVVEPYAVPVIQKVAEPYAAVDKTFSSVVTDVDGPAYKSFMASMQ